MLFILFSKVTEKSFEFWEQHINSMNLMLRNEIPVGLVSTLAIEQAGLRPGTLIEVADLSNIRK